MVSWVRSTALFAGSALVPGAALTITALVKHYGDAALSSASPAIPILVWTVGVATALCLLGSGTAYYLRRRCTPKASLVVLGGILTVTGALVIPRFLPIWSELTVPWLLLGSFGLAYLTTLSTPRQAGPATSE